MMTNTYSIPNLILGDSIQLEAIDPSHFEGLRIAADHEDIWNYMPMKAHGKFFDEWFNECLTQHERRTQITYVIRRLSDQCIVGSRAYYDIDCQHLRLEVGNGWFTPEVWGTIFNHESLWLLFTQAFEQWQFNRVQIASDPQNKRSYNTLKKLGAKEEGFLREHMIHHNGLITNTVIFSILAREWPGIKEILRNRLELSR